MPNPPPAGPIPHIPIAKRVARFLVFVALVAGGVAAVILSRPRKLEETTTPEPTPAPRPEPHFPITPVSASPYLNTGPEARYVGSDACRKCHEDRHASFRTTGMGRSMAAVDLSREPADAGFDHAKSRSRFEVTRRNGQMIHRELSRAPGSPDMVLCEFPVKYVVGSGRHSLTYLCEIDGFLVESPATWYTAKRAWGMSPGYDVPDHVGFERATGEGCLHCHAGRAEAVGGSLHRMNVIEAAIGCERCHGPGSLHSARHAAPPAPRKGPREQDFTIVNPSRLPRDLAESVCQQCHLRPTAVVPARGRDFSDFRPGLPLSDFVHAFQLESENSGMTVVGHVEQMHLSKCYQRSDRLTCLTCHSPHSEPEPANRVEHYKAACLGCHQPEHCKVPEARRRTESPQNDCVQCHMPRSPTEIPHLAFTHHRIGIHKKEASSPPRTPARLLPVSSLARFPEIDQRRSLGLGYLEAANRQHDPTAAGFYREQAFGLLSGVRSAGLRDSAVDASLARLNFDRRQGDVLPLADSALADPKLAGQDRCNALLLRADALAAEGRAEEAVKSLRELTTLRRHPTDWLLLARCERDIGHPDAELAALVAATRINPRLWDVHKYLADRYEQKGDRERAAWHRQRAVR